MRSEEVDIEVFFKKIISLRNNLRVFGAKDKRQRLARSRKSGVARIYHPLLRRV